MQQGDVCPIVFPNKLSMFWLVKDNSEPIMVDVLDMAIGMDGILRIVFHQNEGSRNIFLEEKSLELKFCDGFEDLKGPFECRLCKDVKDPLGIIIAEVGQIFSDQGEPIPVNISPSNISIACK